METVLEYNIRRFGNNIECKRCNTSNRIGCTKWGLKCLTETHRYGDSSSHGATGPSVPSTDIKL